MHIINAQFTTKNQENLPIKNKFREDIRCSVSKYGEYEENVKKGACIKELRCLMNMRLNFE